MEKVICFGIGQIYNGYRELIHSKFEVVGLIDNDKNKQGQVVNLLEVKSLKSLLGNGAGLIYDKILITTIKGKKEIFNQLINFGIPIEKISSFYLSNGEICVPEYQIINDRLICSAKGIRLIIENEFDDMIFNEVIIGGAYELGLNDNSNYVAIDIGANVADSALYFATIKNIVKIYAFEPFKSIFNRGLENLKLNPSLSNKIEYNNFAISNKNEELFLEDIDSIGANIINLKKGTCKIIVKDVTEIFSDIFAKHNEEIFLKMDCEGSEWEILEKLDFENILNKISVIAMECHYTDKNVIEKLSFLKNLLKKNNFLFRHYFTNKNTHSACYAFNINVSKR